MPLEEQADARRDGAKGKRCTSTSYIDKVQQSRNSLRKMVEFFIKPLVRLLVNGQQGSQQRNRSSVTHEEEMWKSK